MASAVFETMVETIIADDERLHEIIDGQKVEKRVGYQEVLLANRLGFLIMQFTEPGRMGTVAVEVMFYFGQEGKPRRRPDLAFVSQTRWPLNKKKTEGDAWAVVPELAVEVVSPSNSANEIRDKIREYFEAGVLLVWIVYPRESLVYVYDGPESNRIINRTGELDGGTVLPGLRIPMADLFGDPA